MTVGTGGRSRLEPPDTPSSEAAAKPPVDRPLTRGDSVGRYLVLDRLGAGGMGVVYRAYDPELDRQVAVKLLHPDRLASPGGEDARRRLIEEARALARLTHPNVVAVHDTGSVGERVFLAMERIEGQDLRGWLRRERSRSGQRSRPPLWRRILEVFVQAGRGLQAAHEAGLIHRDFKPSNAMVGTDGRVRVLDFGLARPRPVDDGPIDGPAGEPPARVTGTPAYMAPEVRRGLPADERSDQYSFCTALWEAWTAGSPALRDSRSADSTAAAEMGPRDVPLRLRRAVLRGLEPDPARRHPSMHALLAALAYDEPSRRRRAAVAAAAVLLLAVAGWGWWLAAAPARLCRGAEQRLAAVWDSERREAVERAFLATGAAFARGSFAGVAAELDGYARRWSDAHTEACEATHVRGEQSAELLDLRMSCLESRRRELEALVGLFAAADAELVAGAVDAAAGLRGLRACSDGETLLAVVPPPDPAAEAEVAAVRDELDRARAGWLAGRLDEALSATDRQAAAAAELGYPPLTADARVQRGRLRHELGRYESAEADLLAALAAAEEGRHDETRAEALLSLVWLSGPTLGRYPEAARWLEVAGGAVRRLGDPPDLRARWHHAAAQVAIGSDDYRGAVDEAGAALAAAADAAGDADPGVTVYLSTLALTLMIQERWEEALEHGRHLLEVRRRAWGEEHPLVGAAHQTLATVLHRTGRFAEAEEHFRRALAILADGYGPQSAEIAITRTELGALLLDAGRPEEALAEIEASLAIRRRLYGGEHPSVGLSLSYLGAAQTELGRFAAAEESLSESHRVRQASGARQVDIAFSRLRLGELRLRQGRPAEAERHLLATREVLAEALGERHSEVANVDRALGEAALAAGRPAEARRRLEAALAGGRLTHPVRLARVRFTLARSLWRLDTELPRALELARLARDGYAETGRGGQPAHREIVEWLAERPLDGAAAR